MDKIEVDIREYQKLKKYEIFLREILEIFFENPDKVIEEACTYNNTFDVKGEILYHLKCLNWNEKLQADFHVSMEEYINKLKRNVDLMKDITEEVKRKRIGMV